MTAQITGMQFLGKDEILKEQEAANTFCEALFSDPNMPINKLHRHVDIEQLGAGTLRGSDFALPVMKGMAAGEQRYIALRVEMKHEQARYFQEASWRDPFLVLLYETRLSNGLPSRQWNLKFTKRVLQGKNHTLQPGKVALLLTHGLYTHYEGDSLIQLRLKNAETFEE